MIVQHLVWNEKPNTKELYYHANGTVCFTKNGMLLQAGTEVRFDTYFNLFDATTWKRYADIGEVQIWVEVEGRGTVQLYTEQASIVKPEPSVEQELIGKQKSVVKQKRVTKQELLKKQKVIVGYALLEEEKQSAKKELSVGTKRLGSQDFCGRQRVCFTLEAEKKGFYYVVVRAKRSSLIHSGAVETTQTPRTINLALVTCTYNRKEALQKNVNLLRRANKVKQANETKQINQVKLEELPVISHLYIVDNARTVRLDEIATEEDKDWLTLLPNPNTGGAGGFSRGLKEAMQQPEITHMLLMDDDVEVEFEAIYRTKSLLCYLKPDYEEHFIGGAMFRMDKPWMLHAAGESWNNGCIINPHKNMDMRTFEAVKQVAESTKWYKNLLSNESVVFGNKQSFHKNMALAGKEHFYQSTTEVYQQSYAAWWYCCIPRTHVEKKGYPLPLFLHCDDVEYGLRNGRSPIYLNGIAVWHEEFDDKRSSVMEYYDTRNRLITNALYMKKGKRRNAVYIICERFYASVFRYRYEDFVLAIKAVEDFRKGMKWLESLDAEQYHKSLKTYGYTMKPISPEFMQMRSVQKVMYESQINLKHSTIQKFAVIGNYFLPARGKAVIRMGEPVSAYAGKKEVLLLDGKTQKGFVVRKSWKKTFSCLCLLLKMGIPLVYGCKKDEWKL